MEGQGATLEALASFTVKPVYLEEGSTRLGRWTLRRFQEEVRDAVASKKDAIVTAVTGGGKTVSLLLGDKGFVGLYPNNTLLLDQQRSIDRILRLALGAELVSRFPEGPIDVLRVYEAKAQGGELPIARRRKVAVVLLSGRYIGYEYDKEGRLIPKREVILKEIVGRLQDERNAYVITLATPDTALMIMMGTYRSFERVGYAIHDAILASAEGASLDRILSEYRVATARELSDLTVIGEYLLKYPWFVDECHLYGDYEASLLLPVLKVHREQAGHDYPVILSSATPSGALCRKAAEYLRPREIKAGIKEGGPPDSFVRGETEVDVVAVPSRGGGIAKWLNAGFEVASLVKERINEINDVINKGGNVFIVVDRVNQVPPIVDVLKGQGIAPECSVSVRPNGCSDGEEPVVVGSESISQGIDRENVRLGIISAYNSVSLIQRFGRVGRKTWSKVVLVVPELGEELPIERLNGREVSYDEFVEAVRKTYFDAKISELMKSSKVEEFFYERRSRLVEVVTTIAYAKASGTRGALEALSKVLRDSAGLLDMFYGPAETIAEALMFRRSGFPVMVEKPGGEQEIADVGVVLRNFPVEGVRVDFVEDGRVKKRMVVLKIGMEPGRSFLAMKPEVSESIGKDLRERNKLAEDLPLVLDGRITTIGELASLGYSLSIRQEDEGGRTRDVATLSSDEVLKVPDVKEQAIAVVSPPTELLDFYVYTVQGVKIEVGQKAVLGLFI